MTALDFPTAPSNGDTYQNYVYDSTAGVWKRFTAGLDLNDITDVTLTSPTDGQALVYDNATSNWVNGEGSSVPVAVSETAPVSPEVGELWLNSTEAKMYVYYDDGSSAQWVAAVGGTVPQQGKILQVVSTTKTNTFSSTSTSFTDITGLSATITPSSASNKVYVSVSVPWGHSAALAGRTVMTIADGSNNNLLVPDSPGSRPPSFMTEEPSDAAHVPIASFSFLHSPSTSSAFTYKVRGLTQTGTFYVNRGGNDADANNVGRGVATITLMEVAA